MKASLKPASPKARAILKKLQALAERGVEGEKAAAQRKIDRLKARFDFYTTENAEPGDLFTGTFKRSRQARWIFSFSPDEFDIGNAVKWAIESATGIHCVHRERDLLAEAAQGTANRLAKIAGQITAGFRALLVTFCTVQGVTVADRGLFVRGLYDGMMNDPRETGQALPNRAEPAPKRRGKRAAPNAATGLKVHPYTLAFGLGKQMRFAVPLGEIVAELETETQRLITKASS